MYGHAALYVCICMEVLLLIYSLRFTPADTSEAHAIIPGEPLTFKMTFRHSALGRYEARLTLTLQGSDEEPFVIARRLLVVVVGDAQDRELLKPVARYIRPVRVREIQNLPILSGEQISTNRTQ